MLKFKAFVAAIAVVGLFIGSWAFAKPGSTDPQACACHNHHSTAVCENGDLTSQQRMAACPSCNGSGNGPFNCFSCKGTGRSGSFQCSFCNGRGWQKCSSCNGTGQK